MNDYVIRSVSSLDFESILALNQSEVKATSEIDLAELKQLDDWSIYHKVITLGDQVVAFLLVLAPGSPYQSLNYRWFENKVKSFYYVDRIVVDNNFIGKGLGSMLYTDLIQEAKSQGIQHITCEFNIKPLNVGSQAFHQSFGFKELGNQWLQGGKKQVSLQILQLFK
ncbi:MAG: GNAT family N-acetyltransferase [Marinicella sp.]